MNPLLYPRDVFGDGHKSNKPPRTLRYTKENASCDFIAERGWAPLVFLRAPWLVTYIIATGGAGSLGSPAAVRGRSIISAASSTSAPTPAA
jgi:hypothetical protein